MNQSNRVVGECLRRAGACRTAAAGSSADGRSNTLNRPPSAAPCGPGAGGGDPRAANIGGADPGGRDPDVGDRRAANPGAANPGGADGAVEWGEVDDESSVRSAGRG